MSVSLTLQPDGSADYNNENVCFNLRLDTKHANGFAALIVTVFNKSDKPVTVRPEGFAVVIPERDGKIYCPVPVEEVLKTFQNRIKWLTLPKARRHIENRMEAIAHTALQMQTIFKEGIHGGAVYFDIEKPFSEAVVSLDFIE